jgi:PAS domain S-box-containing protein
LPAADVEHLVHDLQVHQVELEMQNESLRRAQLAIEQSQEQYQEFFDYAPAGYLIVDAPGTIERANHAALAMLGAPRSHVIGRSFASFVSPADLEVLEHHMSGAQWEARSPCEVRLRPSKAATTHVRLDMKRMPGENGRTIVLTDTTERASQLEAEQRVHLEREADLLSRIGELEAEIVRIARGESQRLRSEGRNRDSSRLESLGMLAGGIAHDFNNLLVGVLGNADLLLQMSELPTTFREPLMRIKRAGRGAADLTRQLLVFAGLGRLSMVPVSLPAVVAAAVDPLRAGVPPSVQIVTSIDSALPSVRADSVQVQQVVMNLVTNAIEAVDARGSIEIQLRETVLDAAALAACEPQTGAEPGHFVVLQVQDSGPGIDDATLSRIFEPFFTTKFTGRGLGLATTLGIMQAHHGALRVRTLPGRGTSFEVAFPLAETSRESRRPVAARDRAWKGAALLIDDDDTVRSVVPQMLERLGFEVTFAHGGVEGVELFCREQPRFDLVVLDWSMPDLSGERVLPALRELQPELPVILISGYSIEELAAHDERAVRVQKPMSLAELDTAVCALLGDREDVMLAPSRHTD